LHEAKALEYHRTMPGLYYQPIRRREFLKTSFLAGAAVALHKLINLPALGYNFWEGERVGWVEARF
jgi:hypothetical protein